MVSTPDEKLHKLAELFEQRNRLYASTYKRQGEIMLAVFGDIVPEANNKIDASRMYIFSTIVSKISRYAVNWETGHRDSLDDIAVYAQMLCELDELKENNK